MTTIFTQFLHISQFYETLMLVIITVPLLAYVLVLKHELWRYTSNKLLKQYQQYEQHKEKKDQAQSQIQRQIDSIEESSRTQNQQETIDNNNLPDTTQSPDSETRNRQQSSTPMPNNQTQQQPRKTSMSVQIQKQIIDDSELTQTQKKVLYFHEQIVEVYDKHLPVILVVVTLGILVRSSQVFSLGMFYFYIISSLMLDYVQTFQKLKKQYQFSFIAPFVNLISGGFLIGIFVSLFARGQFPS